MDNISGKTIAITGAARGIGHATARALLVRGARVVIGDRDVNALQPAVAALDRLGPVSGYPFDVTNRQSFAEFLDKARGDGGGRIDVLINNAGVMPVGPFLQQSEQAIRSAIEVNLYGVLNGCRLVLPEMVERRGGHIVNIASMAGMTRSAGPGGVRRHEVRGRRDCRPRWPTSSPTGRGGERGAADVHQHRADHRHHRRRPRSGRFNPKTLPRPWSRC